MILKSAPTSIGEEVFYAWIDEDGNKISPTHRGLGPALSFVVGWQEHFDRLTRRLKENERELNLIQSSGETVQWKIDDAERKVQSTSEAIKKKTLTGKPPVRLKRMVVRVTIEDISEHERVVSEAALEA